MRIAVIGLGRIGSRILRELGARFPETIGVDRDQEKVQNLQAEGFPATVDPKEAAGAEVYLVAVSTGPEMEGLFAAAAAIEPAPGGLVNVYEGYYRTFMYIDDLIGTMANVCERFRPGRVYNLGGTEYRSVEVVNKLHGGAASALNVGINHALGRYIAWLSADDLFLPNKLQLQLAAMRRRPDAGLCYTDWYVIDKDGRITGRMGSPTLPTREAAVEALLQGCCINGSTVLILRAALARTGLFNEAYRQAHDYDLWLRMARYFPFVHVPRPLIKYRWHDRNLSKEPDALAYNAEILANARRLHGR